MKFLTVPPMVALLFLGTATKAGDFTAIVEEASPGAPVQVFSYLPVGHVVDLGAEAEIVLGYLHSCVQERLRGGVVTIGRVRSKIRGGQRSARRLDCGASADLPPNEAEQDAVLVIRRSGPDTGPMRLASDTGPMRLMSVSPLIAPKKPTSSVRLTRLDRSEPVMTLELRDGVADLAALGKTLSPGGSYRVDTGADSIVARVDRNARAGDEQILPRLLSF